MNAFQGFVHQHVPRPVRRCVRWCWEKIKGAIALTVGRLVYWLMATVVAIFPLVREYYKVMEDKAWLFCWLALFVALAFIDRFAKGSAVYRVQERLGSISDALGGTIERFQVALFKSKKRELDQTQAREVMSRTLQRIRQIAEVGFDIPESCRVRATVALPEIDKVTQRPTSLRVWAYDDDHTDAHHSRFALGQGLPGAPAAFETGAVQIIEDIHKLPGYENRKYRSVLSIPVRAAGSDSEQSAVVSIDTSVVDFFRDAEVQRVVRLMSPALHLVAFIIASTKEKAGNARGR